VNRTLLDPKQEPLKDPLPGLKKQLEDKYGDLAQERIDEVAKHAVGRLAKARVKDFVPVLAWRHARHRELPNGRRARSMLHSIRFETLIDGLTRSRHACARRTAVGSRSTGHGSTNDSRWDGGRPADRSD